MLGTHIKAGENGEPMLVNADGKRAENKASSVIKAGKGGVPVCVSDLQPKGNVLKADADGRPYVADQEPPKATRRRGRKTKPKATKDVDNG